MNTSLLVSLFLLLPILASCDQKKVYIVYFGDHSAEKPLHEIEDTHRSYLLSVKETEQDARSSLLYSYKHSINGFAALLKPEEASKLSDMEEVVSVFPSNPRKHSLHTTRSWEFVGLEEAQGPWEQSKTRTEREDLLEKAKYGQDIIVGVLDSGVWPESNSFSDEGMAPIPESWKGICQTGADFDSTHCNRYRGYDNIEFASEVAFKQRNEFYAYTWRGLNINVSFSNNGFLGFGRYINYAPAYPLVKSFWDQPNRKIIGARYYIKGYENFYGPLNQTLDSLSSRDKDGHGTHTSSTVAGRLVSNVSALGGFAHGTASGGAPLARLAIYKVCWAKPGQSKADGNTCFEEDMLAAIDDAIADGVHVLSISIGTEKPMPYTEDGIAIGALHASKNNIVVACSAGNAGPTPSTLSNPAPWIITVGASSVDRAFFAPVILGNGMRIKGQTVTPSQQENKFYPLVYAADVVSQDVSKEAVGQCLPGSLSPEKAKGKIVLCMRGLGTRVGKGIEVKRAGGVGFILGNSAQNGNEIACDAHVLPATAVTNEDALTILKYINSTKNPMAHITPGQTVVQTKPAPFMAAFTSRGPNVVDPNILKPDITAPGLNIIAAWSEADPPTKLSDQDHRVAQYNILSGTSMSCPHVSGAAALLKAIHPSWSSAAIRSALMTTAGITNNVGKPLTDESGAAANPFAFGSGHFRPTKAADPGLVYDASHTDYLLYLCSQGTRELDPSFKCPQVIPKAFNLNYPSLQISKLKGTVSVKRTVTNVGDPKSIYYFSSRPPMGFSMKAFPNVLFFNHVGEKKSFTIKVKARRAGRMTLKMNGTADEYTFGWYAWSDVHHTVRSPVAISSA